ncbi:hypothetical protein Tco_0656835 [Tanacetum coccineum]|uniref:Reverse transcriptase domain-containing protein n=1 Tax=Tanacetum coccineum TaxID=301880 RepID=A0ABQ4X9Y1_9ASTR
MEAQYGKFLDMFRAVRINVPLIDVLAGMPNYGKFLKELESSKHNLEQISSTFLSDESSAMIQNKVPPKLRDLGSFLIPCTFSKAFSCNALADLDRSFQHPTEIAKNMLVEVGKFTFPVDFVILEMEEVSKVPLILGRPFSILPMHIDVIDEILEDFDALLDEGTMTADENSEFDSDKDEPKFEKITINTDHKIKTTLEEPHSNLELKPLPDNLEYVFLEEPYFLPVIISS